MSITNFAIYYTVADNAFQRAARTWANGLGPNTTCSMFAVSHVYEIVNAFKLMESDARARGEAYQRGALFVHSSPPETDEDSSSQSSGVHMRPLKPKTLAELRYKEEYLAPAGLNVDTASISLLSHLPRLPWMPDGEIHVFGCRSGLSEPGKSPIAQVLADTQGVKTYGQRGYAYFSSKYDEYERIKPTDNVIYLRSYMRTGNIWLETKGGHSGTWGRALPEQAFTPKRAAGH